MEVSRKLNQFLDRKSIDVTILDVVDPVHFIVRETPSVSMSAEGCNFLSLEKVINQHYSFFLSQDLYVPQKDDIVIALCKEDSRYYRAQVIGILESTKGLRYKVNLLDYGALRIVNRDCVYEIKREYLQVPFQAVCFRLIGLKPLSLIMSPLDLSLSYGPANRWDESAVEFVRHVCKKTPSAKIEVRDYDLLSMLYGIMYIQDTAEDFICLNDMLKNENFAHYDEEAHSKRRTISSSSNPNQDESQIIQPNLHLLEFSSVSTSPKQPQMICTVRDVDMQQSTKVICKSSQLLSPTSSTCSSEIKIKTVPFMNILENKPTICNTDMQQHYTEVICHSLPPEKLLSVEIDKICNSNQPLSPTSSTCSSDFKIKTVPYINRLKNKPMISTIKDAYMQQQSMKVLCDSPPPLLSCGSLKICDSNQSSPAVYTCSSNVTPKTVPFVNSLKSKLMNSTISDTDVRQEYVEVICNSPPPEKVLSDGSPKICDSNQLLSTCSSDIKPKTLPFVNLLKSRPTPSTISDANMQQQSMKVISDSTLSEKLSSAKIYESNQSSSPAIATCSSDNKIKTVPFVNMLQSKPTICTISDADMQQHSMKVICHSPPGKLLNSESIEIYDSNQSLSPVSSTCASDIKSKHGPRVNILKWLQQAATSESNAHISKDIISNNLPMTADIVQNHLPQCGSQIVETVSSVQVHTNVPATISTSTLIRSNSKNILDQSRPDSKKIICQSSPYDSKKIMDQSGPDNIRTLDQKSTLKLLQNLYKKAGQNSPKTENSSVVFGSTISSSSDDLCAMPTQESNRQDRVGNELRDLGNCSTVSPSKQLSHTEKSEVKSDNDSANEVNKLLDSFKVKSDNVSTSDGTASSDEDDVVVTVENSAMEVKKGICLLDALKQKYSERASHVNETNFFDSSGIKTDLDFSNRCLFDEQCVPCIQIGNLALKPILRTENTPFVKLLQDRLNALKFWGPSCIQSVVWPAILRGRSFVAIAPPHSGKTVAYLLPILSSIIHGMDYAHLPAGNGPIAIILCSSWKQVRAVDQQAQVFLGNCGKVSVLTACSDGTDPAKKKSELLKGSDILIATPSHLLEHLDSNNTNFERCCHLILDDSNDIIKYHADTLKGILSFLLSCFKQQKNALHAIQMGLCAEHWTKSFNSFVEKFMVNHLLLFTSFLEAAIYRHISAYVQICHESTKASSLIALIGARPGLKIIICTLNAVNATKTSELLKAGAVYAHLAHESMAHFNLSAIKKKWVSHHSVTDPFVLVLTDGAMLDLNITDADCLIHYDLPELSKLQFGNRFACFSNSLSCQQENVKSCVSHIFVTEECKTQGSALINILRRLGSAIPRELKLFSSIKKQANVSSDMPLCHYFKAFGYCRQVSCLKRHVINPTSDAPSVIPKQGDVHVVVNHVFNASHYYVQILQYIDPETGSTISRTAEYANLMITMQDFFKEPEENVSLLSAELHTMCCVKDKTGMYHRAKILNVSCIGSISKVIVMYIDVGWVRTIDVSQLLVLPEQFSGAPPIAAEVYLCNVKPYDSCDDWNPEANQFVLDNIGGQEVHGKIVLCLGNTLFLDPIIIRESKLSCVREPVTLFHVGMALKENMFAADNRNHLSVMLRSCEGHIDQPLVIRKVDASPAPKANRAFLELDKEDYVYVCHIESPHLFYVQRDKFCDSLDSLVADINKRVANNCLSPCQVLQIGMFCIACLPDDNKYYRGEIIGLNEADGEMIADVFFVDFGDRHNVRKNQLFAISPGLMLFPFQAVECELAGVKAPHGGWTDRTVYLLYDLTRNEDNCTVMLMLKALSKTERYGGGNHYMVDLYNNKGLINDVLVQEGLCSPEDKPISATLSSDTEAPEEEGDIENCIISEPDDVNDDLYNTESALFYGMMAQMKPQAEKLNELDAIKQKKREEKIEELVNGDGKDNTLANFSSKPDITWWDTKITLLVTLHLPGLGKYNIDFHKNGFKFSARIKTRIYLLNEIFHDEIIPDKTQVKKLDNAMEFVFYKALPKRWPRLTNSKLKVSYIKYDFEHLNTGSSSDEEDMELIPEHIIEKLLNDGDKEEKIHHVESSDEDNNQEEEEEFRVKPWSKMCDDKPVFGIRR